jgi:hypothetical protein
VTELSRKELELVAEGLLILQVRLNGLRQRLYDATTFEDKYERRWLQNEVQASVRSEMPGREVGCEDREALELQL